MRLDRRPRKLLACGPRQVAIGNSEMAYIELEAKDTRPKIALYQHPHFIIQIETDSGTLFLKMQRQTLDFLFQEMKQLPKRTPR
jgi:hypothetical protein